MNDAYDSTSPILAMWEEDFLRQVHAALRSGGLLAVNVLGAKNVELVKERVTAVFGVAHVTPGSSDQTNTWVMGYKNGPAQGAGAGRRQLRRRRTE